MKCTSGKYLLVRKVLKFPPLVQTVGEGCLEIFIEVSEGNVLSLRWTNLARPMNALAQGLSGAGSVKRLRRLSPDCGEIVDYRE